MAKHFFTSESVTEGHPDKVCDQISDAVLDAILAKDPQAHVACETIATTGLVLVMGEISTSCYVEIPKIAREVIRDIGYTRAKYGFDADTLVQKFYRSQFSPEHELYTLSEFALLKSVTVCNVKMFVKYLILFNAVYPVYSRKGTFRYIGISSLTDI